MKRKHITQPPRKKQSNHLKPLVLSVCSALGFAASHHAFALPFKDLPPYLQNTLVTATQNKVKPNVVFLVDDSNFMNKSAGTTQILHTFDDGKVIINIKDKKSGRDIPYTLNPKNLMLDGGCPKGPDGHEDPRFIDPKTGWCTMPLPPQSLKNVDPNLYKEFQELQVNDGNGGKKLAERVTKVKETLQSVVGKYQDRVNWGLQTLHNNGNSDTDNVNASWRDMQRRIGQIESKYPMIPLTRRYYETVRDRLLPAVKYRCQKSYVVVLTSSKSDTSCHYTNYVFGSNGYSEFAGDLGAYPKIPDYYPQHWRDCLNGERKYQKRYPNMRTCPWEAYGMKLLPKNSWRIPSLPTTAEHLSDRNCPPSRLLHGRKPERNMKPNTVRVSNTTNAPVRTTASLIRIPAIVMRVSATTAMSSCIRCV